MSRNKNPADNWSYQPDSLAHLFRNGMFQNDAALTTRILSHSVSKNQARFYLHTTC